MKITLRELFLIVLLIALALGWWLDRRGLSRENNQLGLAAGKLGRLLTHHGWQFTSSESVLRLQRGELQTSIDLPPAQARQIHTLAATRVEPHLDPLLHPESAD